jgi:hypothetical protein
MGSMKEHGNSRSRQSVIAVACAWAIGFTAGCTALGPMPATTGASMVPAQRPDVEAAVGVVPGYYLSSSVQSSPKGAAPSQASLMVEPERLIGVPGLVAGARYVGNADSGGYLEPMAGYRTFVDADRRLAAGAVGYATNGSGTANHASYSATRGGVEAGLDVRPLSESRWVELHLLTAAAVTGVSARGDYCIDVNREYGVDCPATPSNLAHASAAGFYPSVTAGVAVDFARHLDLAFHGGRVAVTAAGGTMPAVVSGEQTSPRAYAAAGLSVTLGVGAVQ